MEMKKINYMLEIDILRNSSQNFVVSWGVLFKGLGVQKDTQTPCWLWPWQGLSRLWVECVIWTPRTLFFDSSDTQKFMSEFADDDFS